MAKKCSFHKKKRSKNVRLEKFTFDKFRNNMQFVYDTLFIQNKL